jgi:hypothetical protein
MSNDKQTTALQQLRWFISDGLENYDESIKVSEIWAKINELLPIERQQIEDAYDSAIMKGRQEDGKQYFNETFTQ